jgi:hypothetical protein
MKRKRKGRMKGKGLGLILRRRAERGMGRITEYYIFHLFEIIV